MPRSGNYLTVSLTIWTSQSGGSKYNNSEFQNLPIQKGCSIIYRQIKKINWMTYTYISYYSNQISLIIFFLVNPMLALKVAHLTDGNIDICVNIFCPINFRTKLLS